MKRLGHSEKLKLWEKAKTILIVLLLFLCVFLGYRILRLYNAQNNAYSALWGSFSDSSDVMESSNQTKLSVISNRPQPMLVALNTPSARTLIDADSQNFADLSELANALMCEAYRGKSEEITSVDIEEWKNILNSTSVYFKYPIDRHPGSDAALLGEKSPGETAALDSFCELLIAYKKDTSAQISLYVADKEHEKFLKFSYEGDVAKIFKERVLKLNADDEKKWAFSWELNRDKVSQDNKALLGSMLLIPTGEVQAADIHIEVPRLYRTGLNFTKTTDLTLGLVNAFNYNPNTIRQYVGKDNSIMFVGETGSLNLHPDGLIEYKALDTEDGVPITGTKEVSDMVFGLCTRLEKIMRISGINTRTADFEIKLTSMPDTFRFDRKNELCFDYFADGKKVKLLSEHAVCATLQEGKLIELKLNLLDIEVQGRNNPMPDLLDETDRFYATSNQNRNVKEAYAVYNYQADAEVTTAEWEIEGAR